MEVELHSFLTAELDRVEWLVSRPVNTPLLIIPVSRST
jgi:hypothetical protein